MIFGRLLAVLIASVALVSCAGVVLVSLVFAVWALLAPAFGGVGATAAVIFAVAALVALAGGGIVLALRPRDAPVAASGPTLDGALGFVRERPVVSVVAAAGALLLAAVQPRLAVIVARNLLTRNRRPQP